MDAPTLVTGGTGNLGSHLVPMLRASGHDVRVLSRHEHPPGSRVDGVEYVICDLRTRDGLDAALAGVDTIVHLAGGLKGDEATTRNLVTDASRAGVRHLVYISVIAADKVPVGYFKSKAAAERVIEASGIPFTMLRAAQFHDLAYTVVHALARSPIVPIPGMRWQPVDVREVAARLVDLSLDQPAGRVRDLAGPQIYTGRELIEEYLHAAGKRRVLMPMWMPGKIGRVYRAGENLAQVGADEGKRTWEEFLVEKAGS